MPHCKVRGGKLQVFAESHISHHIRIVERHKQRYHWRELRMQSGPSRRSSPAHHLLRSVSSSTVAELFAFSAPPATAAVSSVISLFSSAIEACWSSISWAEVPGVGGLKPRVPPGFRGVYAPPWNPIRGSHGACYPPPPKTALVPPKNSVSARVCYSACRRPVTIL